MFLIPEEISDKVFNYGCCKYNNMGGKRVLTPSQRRRTASARDPSGEFRRAPPAPTRKHLVFALGRDNKISVIICEEKSTPLATAIRGLDPHMHPVKVCLGRTREELLVVPYDELVRETPGGTQARLSLFQAPQILENALFTFTVDDEKKDKIVTTLGRLDPEFVDGLLEQNKDRLDALMKLEVDEPRPRERVPSIEVDIDWDIDE